MYFKQPLNAEAKQHSSRARPVQYRLQWLPQQVLLRCLWLAAAVPALLSCSSSQQHPPRMVTPAFYHWKSSLWLSSSELKALNALHIDTLYVKFFDVEWDELKQEPIPAAKLNIKQLPPQHIIPVVFVTNETLQQLDTARTGWLAEKIATLVKLIITGSKMAAPAELQIDCDWSATTREKYFRLLRQLRPLLPGMQLSATIRLYQTKYYEKAGVPPVDRGLLMCYNMGNLKSITAGNSIIEIKELEKYTANLGSYPLPLDVALPVFAWKVWFRKGEYYGITEELPDAVLSSSLFARNGSSFTALSDTVVAGYSFRKGDVLRPEESNAATVQQAASIISSKLKNTRCRVSLYHLDSLLLTKYSVHELESFYSSFR